MDGVTAAISALDFWPITQLALFIDQYLYALLFFLAAVLYLGYPSVKKNKLKLAAFAISLCITMMAVVVIKEQFAVPRECGPNTKLPECPTDYSFPSGHTAFAFTFAGASLGTTLFPLFFLIAFATAISRIYVGIHTLNDVVGGVSLALGIYFFIENALLARWPAYFGKWAPTQQKPSNIHTGLGKLIGWSSEQSFEFRRQVSHIVYGTIIVAAVYFLNVAKAEILLLSALFFGMCVMHLRMEKKKTPLVDFLFDFLERPMVMPAKGAFMYTVGALLALSFLPNTSYALATIAGLAWGDGMATIFGRYGKTKLPYNKKKSVLGTAAFVLFAFTAAYFFVGWRALPLAILCGLIESWDNGVDDNFAIPVAGVVFFLLTG